MTTTGGGHGEPPAGGGCSGMEIAPFLGLRFDMERVGAAGGDGAGAVTSPPYDVITPADHRRLLEASKYNITRLTLGNSPGEASSYEERAATLARWVERGILSLEDKPAFYVYRIEYALPGADGPAGGGDVPRCRFLGLIALGRLHPFEDAVVLPHERTFPKVVEDRYRLLEATRTHLETILLLYSDPDRHIDGILEEHIRKAPALEVQARPGEVHAIHPITDPAVQERLAALFLEQRPIIADGHHRYTTSLRYRGSVRADGRHVPGVDWQMMTFANLFGDGLSILATHRLVKLKQPAAPDGVDPADRVLDRLLSRLEVADPGTGELRLETRTRRCDVRFPTALRQGRTGVAATTYALLHDVVLGDWLVGDLDESRGILYFKQGTGEIEALMRSEGDLLFRMQPVDRSEFETVVQGGEVFPHKTTYFYPKLWSGLVLWSLADPGPRPKLQPGP